MIRKLKVLVLAATIIASAVVAIVENHPSSSSFFTNPDTSSWTQVASAATAL